MGMGGQAKPFQPEEELKQNSQFIMGGAAGFNNNQDQLDNNQKQGSQQSKRGVQGRQPHGQQQQYPQYQEEVAFLPQDKIPRTPLRKN